MLVHIGWRTDLLDPAVFEDGQLDAIGSEPPAGSVVTARLLTPLNSRTTPRGTPVEAQLIRPLFYDDHRLLFPVGARLHGIVTESSPSRSRHRNGEMAFNLTTISAPEAWMSGSVNPQEVDGSLVSIGVSHDMKDLRIKGKLARRAGCASHREGTDGFDPRTVDASGPPFSSLMLFRAPGSGPVRAGTFRLSLFTSRARLLRISRPDPPARASEAP